MLRCAQHNRVLLQIQCCQFKHWHLKTLLVTEWHMHICHLWAEQRIYASIRALSRKTRTCTQQEPLSINKLFNKASDSEAGNHHTAEQAYC